MTSQLGAIPIGPITNLPFQLNLPDDAYVFGAQDAGEAVGLMLGYRHGFDIRAWAMQEFCVFAAGYSVDEDQWSPLQVPMYVYRNSVYFIYRRVRS